MNNWILARGREAETPLPDVTAAAARSIFLPGASGVFAPPQPLFISEPGGAEAEWLGRVTRATAAELSFSRPVRASKGTGALVWRPASFIEFSPEAARPDRRATASGVATERTPDGIFFAVQTAQPTTELRLVFDDLAPTQEDALIAWLAAQTRWGLDPFTLVDPSGMLDTVRLANEPLRQERDAAGRRRAVLSLIIVEEGAYP